MPGVAAVEVCDERVGRYQYDDGADDELVERYGVGAGDGYGSVSRIEAYL